MLSHLVHLAPGLSCSDLCPVVDRLCDVIGLQPISFGRLLYSRIHFIIRIFPCQLKLYFAWYNHIILSYIFLKNPIKKSLVCVSFQSLVDNYHISLSIVALVKPYIFSYFNIFL